MDRKEPFFGNTYSWLNSAARQHAGATRDSLCKNIDSWFQTSSQGPLVLLISKERIQLDKN